MILPISDSSESVRELVDQLLIIQPPVIFFLC
ncbi:MAG: hypothetical protein EBT07_17450 [Actinobacteria bacterium]|nr:hypothetical protein [Actinomycetota bacterium]